MNQIKTYWRWIAAGWIAFVFIQSLFFKFAGAPETQHIFGTLGDFFGLPWFASIGGYLIGGIELVAAIMLFTKIWPWGALLAFEIMSGAIVFHLFTPLGIVMPAFDEVGAVIGDDGGTLFVMACFTWACAVALVVKDITTESSQLRAVLPRR
ncbi:MAG: DoxX family protein [Agarilytica sp.]